MNQALPGLTDNLRLEIRKDRAGGRHQQIEQSQPENGVDSLLRSASNQKMVNDPLQQQRLDQQCRIDDDHTDTGETKRPGIGGGEPEEQLHRTGFRLLL
ncbi:hypothetical protein D3C73_1396180 [compost metagenome]